MDETIAIKDADRVTQQVSTRLAVETSGQIQLVSPIARPLEVSRILRGFAEPVAADDGDTFPMGSEIYNSLIYVGDSDKLVVYPTHVVTGGTVVITPIVLRHSWYDSPDVIGMLESKTSTASSIPHWDTTFPTYIAPALSWDVTGASVLILRISSISALNEIVLYGGCLSEFQKASTAWTGIDDNKFYMTGGTSDGYGVNTGSTFNNTGNNVQLGLDTHAYFKFEDIFIPKYAVIDSAQLIVRSYGNYSGACGMLAGFYKDGGADPAVPTNYAELLAIAESGIHSESQTGTAASGDWVTGMEYNLTGIASVIQAGLDIPSFNPGGKMLLVLSEDPAIPDQVVRGIDANEALLYQEAKVKVAWHIDLNKTFISSF